MTNTALEVNAHNTIEHRYPRRLIEVDLPIKRISEHAVSERSARQGHISTLHVWWARRPLGACRAVLCAALWPDPADPLCPDVFKVEARALMREWASKHLTLASQTSATLFFDIQRHEALLGDSEQLRKALLNFIADFSSWSNAYRPEYIATARALTLAAQQALVGPFAERPIVVDPFAGGGSIPLEALRIGAIAVSSDLNPLATLLNRVVLDFAQRYGNELVTAVRAGAAEVRQHSFDQLNTFYPPEPDGGRPIAYLWARTVLSEAPGQDNAPVEIPLLRSMWLSKEGKRKRAVRWTRDSGGEVVVDIVEAHHPKSGYVKVRRPRLEIFEPQTASEVESGTVRGGAATCPISGYTTGPARVKAQLQEQRGGATSARMYAMYVDGPSGRDFRVATERDLDSYERAADALQCLRTRNPDAIPSELINPVRPHTNTRGLSAVTRIGCETFADLYNDRQLLALHTLFSTLANHKLLSTDEFGVAVRTVLALAVSRLVQQNTSMCRWDSTRSSIKGAFSKHALAVVWDYAEANPFSNGSSNWDGAVDWVARVIEKNAALGDPAMVVNASAMQQIMPSNSVSAVITDPPYFAAIPYADLSDFFYVWLRRSLGEYYPDLFASPLTRKLEELVVTNAHLSDAGTRKDEEFFRSGMTCALASALEELVPGGIGVIVYAEGTTAGWEAVLNAIVDAGWVVTASWPIATEMETRTQAKNAASLQSSVHIVCRPRRLHGAALQSSEVGDWRTVLQELPLRVHEWMPRLAQEGIAGADAIFACLGPAIEIFSRHEVVEKASGERVSLREYLEYVWSAVAREALAMIFEGGDTSGLEEDARLTAMWLWTLGSLRPSPDAEVMDEDAEESQSDTKTSAQASGAYSLDYDAARKIAQGLGAHLDKLTHLVSIKGETARLLPVAERTRYLFGKEPVGRTRPRTSQAQLNLFEELRGVEIESDTWSQVDVPQPGSTILDRVHQSMILFGASRGEALKRFFIEEGVGQDERFWRLAQALSALYPSGADEKRWIDGVLARKKGLGF